MSLGSVLQTGLTGLIAAEQMAIRAGNNLANPNGLLRSGEGSNSDPSTQGVPGQGDASSARNGVTEASPTDMGRSLVDLMLASTQFRANVTVLEVVDELSAELAGIKRMR